MLAGLLAGFRRRAARARGGSGHERFPRRPDRHRRAHHRRLVAGGFPRHAAGRAHRRQLHLLRVGGFCRDHGQHRPLERLVPRPWRPDRQGAHRRRHPPRQGRRPHGDRPRLPEHVRFRGSPRRGRAFQGCGRRHRPAHLQHPEFCGLRLLREPRFGAQRLGPRAGGRDEPGGDADRPQPCGLAHLRRYDPRIGQAGRLHPLPAVRPQAAPAQQERRGAPLHRRAGRHDRGHHVPRLPPARRGVDGGRLCGGDGARHLRRRRGPCGLRHRLHPRPRAGVLRVDHPRQGLRPQPRRFRRDREPQGSRDHRPAPQPHAGHGARRLARTGASPRSWARTGCASSPRSGASRGGGGAVPNRDPPRLTLARLPAGRR